MARGPKQDAGQWLILPLVVAMVCGFIGDVTAQSNSTYASILDVINNHPNLTVVKSMVNSAGLSDSLSNPSSNYTGFLPSDEAFSVLASSLGNNQTAMDLVNSLTTLEQQRLLKYHVLNSWLVYPGLVPFLSQNRTYSTLLTMDYTEVVNFTYMLINTSGIIGTNRAIAAVITGNITAGRSLVHIIDRVIGYWYNDIAGAVAVERPKFAAALKAVGLYDNVTSPSYRGTLLMPSDTAWGDGRFNAYGIILPPGAAGSDWRGADIFKNHVTVNNTVGDPNTYNGQALYTTMSVATPNLVMTTIDNQGTISTTKAFASTVRADFGDNGVTFTALGTTAKRVSLIPINGPKPTTYLSTIDQLLVPTYLSPLQYLNSQPDYKSFVTYANNLAAAGALTVLYLLNSSAAVPCTVLAANENGVKNFLNLTRTSLNVSNGLEAVMKTHILTTVKKLSSFTPGPTLSQSGYTVAVDVSSAAAAQNKTLISLVAAKTTAIIYSRVDVSIMYGYSYVQTVNNLLVPPTVTLARDGSGAAGMAEPSYILLVITALAGWFALKASHGRC